MQQLNAQIRISEIAPTGTALTDEDSDRPDWFEIQNTGTQVINLLNYAFTDDINEQFKWLAPNRTITPGERLVIFASGKNRPEEPGGGSGPSAIHHWETAVKDGQAWTFTAGNAGIPNDWFTTGYSPSGWSQGPGGIGYGDNDDQSTIPAGTLSLFARCNFTVQDKSKIAAVLLNMDYDDGFVAWLNGVEIARSGLSGQPPAWDESAIEHEAALFNGGSPQSFPLDINTLQNLLVDGTNLLAVQVNNTNSNSSDMTMRPFLHFGMADAGIQFGQNPSWFDPTTGSAPDNLHTNFEIKRGETLYIFRPNGTLSDSVTIRDDLQTGHLMARLPNNWCVTDTETPWLANAGVCYTGYAAAPVFNPAPGFYSGNQNISISGGTVYYTTDGARPDAGAAVYSGPVSLAGSTVVRAYATATDKLPSAVVTGSYLIDEPTQLPVVSISAAPEDLFNVGNGPAIYDNYNSGEKAPCHVDYFNKQHQLLFQSDAAAKIVGNFSIAFAQKSMQFTFENDFGAESDMPNVIFNEDKPLLGDLHGFRVRNTDDDAALARMRDVIANRIALTTNAAATASQNVAVFINGRYWGHYSAREMLNEYFVRDNYEADPDSVDIVKTYVFNTYAEAGTMDNFNSMNNFLTNTDLSQQSNFDLASKEIDPENWADYWATQIFIANGDWYSSMYQNNTQCFRAYNSPDPRWKFVLWDCGYSQGGFGGESDAGFNSLDFALASPAQPNLYTPMFNSLLANPGFKRYFINRFADLLNTQWTEAEVHSIINANAAAFTSEIPLNHERWMIDCNNYYCPPDLQYWQEQVQQLKNFYSARPNNQRSHIISHFGLQKKVDITLDVQPAGAGVVKISTVTPETYPWKGVYFDGNPVTLTAIPNPGYSFANWSSNTFISNQNEAAFTANVTAGATTFTANFGPAVAPDLTCTEINYNSDPSTASGNWLELHNYGTSTANLGGYRLQEQGSTTFYTLPNSASIAPGGYLVLADDLAQFQAAYPTVTNVTGPTGIALGNNGDTLELRDASGTLLLTIGYDDNSDWPQCPDGYGRTLENNNTGTAGNLLDPARWFDGCMGGSPGQAYSPCVEKLIFNEINYKSPDNKDAGDWVEIWNKTILTLDLSGWQLRDSRDTLRYTFPAGTMLMPDSFLVIYSNLSKFQSVHGNAAPNKTGPFQFALDGNGEVIRLFDKNEVLFLSMFYNDAAPWPLPPDGEGPTLELRAPFTDLNKGESWAASCDYGTPGRFNSPCATSGSAAIYPRELFRLMPNPASGMFHIVFEAPLTSHGAWRLLDMQGRPVKSGVIPDSITRYPVETGTLPSGIYRLEMVTKNAVYQHNIMLR